MNKNYFMLILIFILFSVMMSVLMNYAVYSTLTSKDSANKVLDSSTQQEVCIALKLLNPEEEKQLENGNL